MHDGGLPVRLGEVIGGRYRVERVLGHGAMAVVVAVRDQEKDEVVAIKIVLPRRVSDPEAFIEGARSAIALVGPHVGRTLDVAALEDRTPYMVMEYLDGENIASMLSRRFKVPALEGLLYILQACAAIEEAHAAGIVHRDLTPANLFLASGRGPAPVLKVLGFGVAKVEWHDRRHAEGREILGSPWYMAPEQLRSAAAADERSDIWSLGVILYELVTGEVPFDGDSMTEVIVSVLNDPTPLCDVRPELPRELEPVIKRCLAKTPSERYQTVTELANVLKSMEGTLALADVVEDPGAIASVRLALATDIKLIDDDDDIVDPDDLADIADIEDLPPSNPRPRFIIDETPTPIAPRLASVPRVIVAASEPPSTRRSTSDAGEPASAESRERTSSASVPASTPVSARTSAPASAPSSAPISAPSSARVSARVSAPASEPARSQSIPPPGPSVTPRAAPREPRRWLAMTAVILVLPIAVLIVVRLFRTGPGAPQVSTTTSLASLPAPAHSTLSPPPLRIDDPNEAPIVVTMVDASSAVGVDAAAAAEIPTAQPPHTPPATTTAMTATTATARPPTPPPPEPSASAAPDDDATVAFHVARRNHGALRGACWDSSEKTTSLVMVSASVSPAGAVQSANATAADDKLAQCVGAQVRTWSFPPSPAARSLSFPIRFRKN